MPAARHPGDSGWPKITWRSTMSGKGKRTGSQDLAESSVVPLRLNKPDQATHSTHAEAALEEGTMPWYSPKHLLAPHQNPVLVGV